MPIVDILLPTYNGDLFVESQIQSLLEQSHKDLRILIRDDGSTDRTLSIIKRLAQLDHRVVLFNEDDENLGLVNNIYFLLNKSAGEYIMYCDQDDYWLKDKVAIMLHELEVRERELGIATPILVHSDCFVTDMHLKVKGLFKGSKPKKYGLRNSLFRYNVQGASTIFNNALKTNLLPFIPNIYLHDRYTHLVAELCGCRFYLDTPLMYYRQHSGNLVGRSSIWMKVKNNLNIKNMNYYIHKDRLLILSLFRTKFPDNMLLGVYLKITSERTSKFQKYYLLFKYSISIRLKELLLILLK
jgi:rhamnosyltransferase